MHTRFTRALAAVICCIVLVASCARLEVFAASTSNTKYSNLDSSKWNLVWSDEFSGDSVDTNKWSFTIGGGGFGNNEQQYYTDSTENAYIENGCLVLNAIQESNGEENYTSAASGVKLVFMLGNVGTTENMAHTISIDDISLYKIS